MRAIAGDDREGRHGFQKEGLHVIAGENDQRIGLGLIQSLAEPKHRCGARVELLGIFLRRPREKLRRMHGGHGGYDFAHIKVPFSESSCNWNAVL